MKFQSAFCLLALSRLAPQKARQNAIILRDSEVTSVELQTYRT